MHCITRMGYIMCYLAMITAIQYKHILFLILFFLELQILLSGDATGKVKQWTIDGSVCKCYFFLLFDVH